MNTVKVFGHKSPDTDTVCSAILFAWFLIEVRELDATPYRLGELNKETAYVLDRWGVEIPELLGVLKEEDKVAIVDTSNPGELPDDLENARVLEIVDHHKMGGLVTNTPLTVNLCPVGCTATIIYQMSKESGVVMPDQMKQLVLSCIISDTLMFRSPTTTDLEHEYAKELTTDLKIDVEELAEQMFENKSDLTGMSALDLLNIDSKMFELKGVKIKVSVLETTSPEKTLELKGEMIVAMAELRKDADIDEVLFFAIDILNENATCVMGSEESRLTIANAFGVEVTSDTVFIPGIVSRKKQIIPKLS